MDIENTDIRMHCKINKRLQVQEHMGSELKLIQGRNANKPVLSGKSSFLMNNLKGFDDTQKSFEKLLNIFKFPETFQQPFPL